MATRFSDQHAQFCFGRRRTVPIRRFSIRASRRRTKWNGSQRSVGSGATGRRSLGRGREPGSDVEGRRDRENATVDRGATLAASRRADPEAIATRLIALLPRLQIPKSTSVKKAPGPTVVTIDRRVLVFCLLMGLMLGVQLLARSVQPQAPADGGRGSAPSAVQAPGPPQ